MPGYKPTFRSTKHPHIHSNQHPNRAPTEVVLQGLLDLLMAASPEARDRQLLDPSSNFKGLACGLLRAENIFT